MSQQFLLLSQNFFLHEGMEKKKSGKQNTPKSTEQRRKEEERRKRDGVWRKQSERERERRNRGGKEMFSASENVISLQTWHLITEGQLKEGNDKKKLTWRKKNEKEKRKIRERGIRKNTTGLSINSTTTTVTYVFWPLIVLFKKSCILRWMEKNSSKSWKRKEFESLFFLFSTHSNLPLFILPSHLLPFLVLSSPKWKIDFLEPVTRSIWVESLLRFQREKSKKNLGSFSFLQLSNLFEAKNKMDWTRKRKRRRNSHHSWKGLLHVCYLKLVNVLISMKIGKVSFSWNEDWPRLFPYF